MYFLLSTYYLFENPQSKSQRRNFLKEIANGNWLTKLKQDAKDKLTLSLLKKSLKILMG